MKAKMLVSVNYTDLNSLSWAQKTLQNSKWEMEVNNSTIPN